MCGKDCLLTVPFTLVIETPHFLLTQLTLQTTFHILPYRQSPMWLYSDQWVVDRNKSCHFWTNPLKEIWLLSTFSFPHPKGWNMGKMLVKQLHPGKRRLHPSTTWRTGTRLIHSLTEQGLEPHPPTSDYHMRENQTQFCLSHFIHPLYTGTLLINNLMK